MGSRGRESFHHIVSLPPPRTRRSGLWLVLKPAVVTGFTCRLMSWPRSALFAISRAHSTPKCVSVRIDRRSLARVDSAQFMEELPTVFFVEHRVLDWAM